MAKYSDEELKEFKQQDYLLLDMELKKAKKNNQKEFKVNALAFEEVPNFKQHIWSWASKNGIDYSEKFNEFIFRIS
nr:MAG TPA: hypothetical protein [Caudoviricetes sp.]